jgi:hypothetical protein
MVRPNDEEASEELEVPIASVISPDPDSDPERIAIYVGDAEDPERRLVGSATLDEAGVADIRIPDPAIEQQIVDKGVLEVHIEDGEKVVTIPREPNEIAIEDIRRGDLVETECDGVVIRARAFMDGDKGLLGEPQYVWLGDHSMVLHLGRSWIFKLIEKGPNHGD